MNKEQFIADNGTVVTDEMIDQWSQEAEAGFPGATITPFKGQAWEVETEPLKPRTIRVSDTLWNLIKKDAAAEHISVSDWARQALTNAVAAR